MKRPDIVVIDPGMGNLRSVTKAWEHAGASVRLLDSPDDVGQPEALVFPGQGGMSHCMQALAASGFDVFIKDWIEADRPFFGICLGLQALFESSDEGETAGLGVFSGSVRRFQLGREYKIPHMGWNAAQFRDEETPVDRGLSRTGDQFYFVHSYHVETADKSLIWSETDYGYRFVSAINRGRCYATQFHPEKSQTKGLQIYRNFVDSL
ncbi:imidazole glycerol phosphate synthase subunit HisH [Rubellicoccus peritrichatus]|uniref:Imidazole glycerol phosphate synthase subunit HisH n=1 Tax=Rubellicoccus peritrichatus TaxID=3080537 RepID=A0AAQ3L6I3_9BACT|nr:imidazole glycerol phosphate synthase subunit HisH [Puniceicoccus sp. CR14]WOO39567.1 imidazole glycerol phosphate synthase subunit HisH [Puniceicoccus sp. CR14]